MNCVLSIKEANFNENFHIFPSAGGGVSLVNCPTQPTCIAHCDLCTAHHVTTSSRRLDGVAYCGAPVGGKCMVSKAKLVLYALAV